MWCTFYLCVCYGHHNKQQYFSLRHLRIGLCNRITWCSLRGKNIVFIYNIDFLYSSTHWVVRLFFDYPEYSKCRRNVEIYWPHHISSLPKYLHFHCVLFFLYLQFVLWGLLCREDGFIEACSAHGEMINACVILVGELRRRWQEMGKLIVWGECREGCIRWLLR
jgi:hypothetical protein